MLTPSLSLDRVPHVMSQAISHVLVEEKPVISTVEDLQHVAPTEAVVRKQIDELNAGHSVQMKSQFDRLSMFKAISTFRKTALICLVAGFCASTDGGSPFVRRRVLKNSRVPVPVDLEHRGQQRVHSTIRHCDQRHPQAQPVSCISVWRLLQVRVSLAALLTHAVPARSLVNSAFSGSRISLAGKALCGRSWPFSSSCVTHSSWTRCKLNRTGGHRGVRQHHLVALCHRQAHCRGRDWRLSSHSTCSK